MNKKFSTLVACAMLATSTMTFAQVTEGSTPTKYEAGKAYLLKVGATGNYLTVNASKQGANTTLDVTSGLPSGLSALQKALWEVKAIPAEAGAVSPKYILTNRFTGTVLALDKSNALSAQDITNGKYTEAKSSMGGDIVEWLVKNPTTTPGENSLYVSYGKDNKVIVLAAGDIDNNASNGDEVYAKIVDATALASDALSFVPFNADGDITLSANDLNTQFGVNGILDGGNLVATPNSFFKLDIKPVVSEGIVNVFGSELQARAVDQWEVMYGKDNLIVEDKAFASLYPEATKPASLSKDNIQARKDGKGMTAYKSNDDVFALYSKSNGQYIVVDTAYYPGTDQVTNKKIKFAYDNLYNAKNETRYRLPESYLFKFVYKPTTNTVEILPQGYIKLQPGDKTTKKVVKTSTALDEFYGKADATNGYSAAAVLLGSEWPSADVATGNVVSGVAMTATVVNDEKVTFAQLVNTTVMTIGTEAAATIKVGVQSDYELGYLAPGVYTIKVAGVADPANKDRVGKYWVKSLKGTSEYEEQAVRQNYQNMPAAQWVVESLGSSTYMAPVKTTNREFGGQFDKATVTSGLVYKAGENFFFFGGDTLQFEKVAKANVDTLGYKYISDAEMKEAVYTFNYLHELAMDKPINTKNDKDSVVWVDKDGSAMKFQLERVVEDTYGYNGGSKSIAQLKRLVYKVRVKDASKLQNDKRYLAYNTTSKKYYVATNTSDASLFFLKENNTLTEGTGYYTLVEASVIENVMPVKLTDDATADDNVYASMETTGGRTAIMVTDADVISYVLAEEIGADDVNGLPTKVWAPKKVTASANTIKVGTDNYILYTNKSEDYASSKVAVDNNTLDLVNGVLEDAQNYEVANSAFAVKKDESRIYRRLGDAEGENLNKDNVLNFFRVNSTDKEYLYEDANSAYSKGLGMNFLGVEGKGDTKNTAMLTKYISGTTMPQYLIAVDTTVFAGAEYICPECGLTTCEHSKIEKPYIDGRFLVNLVDSVSYYNTPATSAIMRKYQWNDLYTRLAFVDARLMGDKMDTLVVKNSVYTGNKGIVKLGEAKTWASNDTITLSGNKHNQALFAFRLIDDTNNFMIESESRKDNVFDGGIAPTGNIKGGWVKIQNGVPVIVNTSFEEAYRQAEIFNVETTDKAATSNEGVEANAVSVTADFGKVIIKNAEGKTVAISNILGQAIANTVITSDNATITIPAGIVVVSVEGEEAVKVIVK